MKILAEQAAMVDRLADAFARNFLMPRTRVGRMPTERAAAHGNGVSVADVLTLTH